MAPDSLTTVSLINTGNQPELFARKVVVIAYTLETTPKGNTRPYFLFSIICPKQKYKTQADWDAASNFRLPSGYSLIKGTREMMYAGQRFDIPPGYGRYFNPGVWDNSFQIDTNHQEIIARIDGVMPAVSTALVEAKEEGGIKPKHINQVLDLGVHEAKLDGRKSAYHCIALELKGRENIKAIDSLGLEYFSYKTLKWASKFRFQYNIPLVRPSHFQLIKQLRDPLTSIYQSQGRTLTFKGAKPSLELQKQLKQGFKQLVKAAAKGQFIHYKGTAEATIKRILKRSKHSRTKVKKLKKLIRAN